MTIIAPINDAAIRMDQFYFEELSRALKAVRPA